MPDDSHIIEFPDDATRSPAPRSEDPAPLPGMIALPLLVRDPEVVRDLLAFAEGPAREEFGLVALRIGVMALRQARGQIDADVVHWEGERLLAGIEADLKSHALRLDQTLTSVLGDYFDPKSGRFQERVDRLVRKDGDLEEILRHQVGNQDSVLSRTLLEHLGPSSALMKVLDPGQTKGIHASIRKTVEDLLVAQRERVIKETKASLAEVVQQFSLDRKGSALGRLKAILDSTHKVIRQNLTLDQPDSPLALLRRELLAVLDRHAKSDADFQTELRNAMAAMAAKRKEVERSPRHGLDFEDAVWEAVQAEAQAQGDVPERVGKTSGLQRACKVGDMVVCLGPDSAAEGEKIVVEAKERPFDLKRALKEIEAARANRGCGVGLFILSRKVAPEGLARLLRVGSDVIVTWDSEDPTDPFLIAGLSVAKAICFASARRRETAKAVDFTAIDKTILEIEKQARLLEDVNRYAGTIRGAADKIAGLIGRARESLSKQVVILNDRVGDLKAAIGGADESAA